MRSAPARADIDAGAGNVCPRVPMSWVALRSCCCFCCWILMSSIGGVSRLWGKQSFLFLLVGREEGTYVEARPQPAPATKIRPSVGSAVDPGYHWRAALGAS